MKSGVIEYIKNNAYIEELFLDFINEFKEQYDLLKNKEKKELLKIKDEIFRNWLFSSMINETYITPNYLINSIVQQRFPGNYVILPVLLYDVKDNNLNLHVEFQYCSLEEHPIINDIDMLMNVANPSIIFQNQCEKILTISDSVVRKFTIQSLYYVNYLVQLCQELNIIEEIRAINCKCFQVSGSYIDFKMLSNKEKLNRIFQATINITMRNINNINNVQKKATRKQIIEFLNNDIKEEDFNRFIDELLPFANNFIENIDQLTEDKNILETIKFAQVLMGDNVGAFIMGTEIRVYFDIYFTTVFSYYLGLLAPTYLGTFLIEEIICGLKESNDFFEKAANVFNDEIGHNLTKLGLELLKMYGEKIKENKESNFHMNNVAKFVKQAKHEKRDVLEKYKECKELYGKDENIIHKFMNIINDKEDELYYFAEEHINKFAKYLIEEKRLKEKTALLYCRNIELFICDFLCYESEEELKKIDNMMVDRYLGEWFISTCATSVSSIKAQIYALSHYFNFLYDEGFISNFQKNKIKETMKNKDKYILKYMEYLG